MTIYSRSSMWAAALALGLACLIAAGTAMVLAGPARSAASTFELTLEGRTTVSYSDEWDVPVVTEVKRQATFRSRAPFCASGTFVDETGTWDTWLFTCDDGTGSLTVSIEPVWSEPTPQWYSTFADGSSWRILDGTGSYAGLRGRGSLQGELLGGDSEFDVTWQSTLQGVLDQDTVAPTIAFSSATATKLRRPAGAYTLRLGIALRDDVADNPVSYTLRMYGGGVEPSRRFGTATTEAVSMTVRIRPPAGARTVRLQLTGEDPVGNAVSVTQTVRLPR